MGFKHRWIFSAALVLGACGTAHGADGELPRSPAAQQAREAYESAVKKAVAEIAEAKSVYLAQLDTALKVAMQSGDLAEANRIDSIRKAIQSSESVPAGGAGPGPAIAANGRLKPGWVVGNIADSTGRPITGATFEVTASGTTLRGERTSMRLNVDEQGHFEQEVPDGVYAVTAYVMKDAGDSHFRMQLHPVDNKPFLTTLSSKQGIARDFVWRLTGVQPGLDAGQPVSHYGGYGYIHDQSYLGEPNQRLALRVPPGTQVIVTLTPRGPLLDGSRGKPIEIKAAVETIGGPMGAVVMDIPYGPYHGVARIVLPDGRVFSLHCAADFRGPFNKADADFDFHQPSVYEMVKPLGVFVSP